MNALKEARDRATPKLRPVEVIPMEHRGQPMLLLRDPLRLSDGAIAVPRPLAPLLAMMDGTRDPAALEAGLQVRYGVRLASGLLERLIDDLDKSFLLETPRFDVAKEGALRAFREAAHRPMTMDVEACPSDGPGAAARLAGWMDAIPALHADRASRPIRGLVSPHIDYQRGGLVYAEVWKAAQEAVRDAELVVLFGTDHHGIDGTLTLTRQSYATPWGVLPTDVALVDTLAGALGKEEVFTEELHHRYEHSLELAAVWLHLVRGEPPVPVVPILCGSFGGFVAGEGDPATHEPFLKALHVLQTVMGERRTLVVAAADLAHMGPAFGDAQGLDMVGRARMRAADERLLSAVCAGSAQSFFDQLRSEGDRRHVCGLPPIYLTLQLLQQAEGEGAGYAVCPADAQGLSYVSIAGVLLR